jgi:hypothetical protein
MEQTTKEQSPDPLGLLRLKRAIAEIVELSSSCASSSSGEISSLISDAVSALENAFRETEQKYEMLKDRYTLLKRSNAALSDELIWLRDQIDDLSTNVISERD